MNEYAPPEALVTTQWVSEHLEDPALRLVEVDVDTQVYRTGHLFEKARVQFERALKLEPRNATALRELRELPEAARAKVEKGLLDRLLRK